MNKTQDALRVALTTLEACKRWHQGDKYRFSEGMAEKRAWQLHADEIDAAIAALSAAPSSQTEQAAQDASEHNKAIADAVKHGTGVMLGNKHIPLDEFYQQPSAPAVERELPTLPEPNPTHYRERGLEIERMEMYTADQMREYARAAVEQAMAQEHTEVSNLTSELAAMNANYQALMVEHKRIKSELRAPIAQPAVPEIKQQHPRKYRSCGDCNGIGVRNMPTGRGCMTCSTCEGSGLILAAAVEQALAQSQVPVTDERAQYEKACQLLGETAVALIEAGAEVQDENGNLVPLPEQVRCLAAVLAQQAVRQEPYAWRFTGSSGLKRYLTQRQYEAQTEATKRWYEPIAQPAVPEGFVLVDRSKIERLAQHAKIAADNIVEYSKAGHRWHAWLLDACTHADIAANEASTLIASAPSQSVEQGKEGEA
jgi:hypothetical protein